MTGVTTANLKTLIFSEDVLDFTSRTRNDLFNTLFVKVVYSILWHKNHGAGCVEFTRKGVFHGLTIGWFSFTKSNGSVLFTTWQPKLLPLLSENPRD